MGTLTVRENLMFSANLRLSGNYSYDKKRLKVENIIKELGLTACADNKVSYRLLQLRNME
jgi:ATP-binding cassette subfamily G (WHITE) protein 2